MKAPNQLGLGGQRESESLVARQRTRRQTHGRRAEARVYANAHPIGSLVSIASHKRACLVAAAALLRVSTWGLAAWWTLLLDAGRAVRGRTTRIGRLLLRTERPAISLVARVRAQRFFADWPVSTSVTSCQRRTSSCCAQRAAAGRHRRSPSPAHSTAEAGWATCGRRAWLTMAEPCPTG